MTAMTRGPLPARVYWTRRLLVFAVALGLVAATVQLVLLAVGSPGEPDRATQVVAEPRASETPDADVTGRKDDQPAEGTKRKKRTREEDRAPVLAVPEGPCTDRDIAVTPTAKRTVGGSPITFVLELRTILTPACTWEVSPQTLTVKITSGDDDIWSSTQCPRAVPSEDVVIRNNVSTKVEVTWSAKRVDEDCGLTDWALPGWYYIEAAALAGEPSDLQFELTAPEPELVTETVDPEPQGGKKGDKKGDRERDSQQDGADRTNDDAPRDGGRR